MKMSGTGEVFLADTAQEIHLIKLENDSITCNSSNLLAFDADIDWDIKKVEGGMSGMLAGGLFNTKLEGSGWVALVSDGPPVLLNTGDAPTFADPSAAITWSSGVATSVKTDVKLKNFIGRSSGESIQMAFQGTGWVLVQPSEGRVDASAGGGGGGGLLREPRAGSARNTSVREALRYPGLRMQRSDPSCPVCATADIVCGKWTILVIRDLAEGRTRFCELERSLAGISPRTLSLRLRELEAQGIVARETFPEVPPRVEYSLTLEGPGAAAADRGHAPLRARVARA